MCSSGPLPEQDKCFRHFVERANHEGDESDGEIRHERLAAAVTEAGRRPPVLDALTVGESLSQK